MIQVGILTVSTSGAAGERADTSGDVLVEMLQSPPLHASIAERAIVPDDRGSIESALRHWADDRHLHLIVTTGGTGLSPTDITPEATLAVVDRSVPGLAEAMRAQTMSATPMAMLSRSVCGCRGASLIVNLPGSPRAVRECLAVILPVLPHAIDILTRRVTEHQPNS